jgi:glycosyltransferase involved in cell wall biosynthesis
VKVSLDATAVPDQARGVGRMVIDMIEPLSSLDLELVVVARRSDRVRWEGKGAIVRAAAPRPRPLRLLWEQVALPRLLRTESVDVHHGPHYTMPWRSPVPCVVTIHDMTFFDHPEWHERVKVPFFRRSITSASRRATALVCSSQITADRLEAWLHPTVPVHVIHLGVDLARFSPEEPTPRFDAAAVERAGVAEPYVLFLGTIEPRKNVPGLVRAFDRIADRHPGVRLVLAGGRGWGWPESEVAIAAARHAGRIVVLGFVDDDALPSLLRRARAVVYPSFEEGFGLPALEALACGAPLVTTTGTSMAEVAGDAAVLVAPGDEDGLAAALDGVLTGALPEPHQRARGLQRAAERSWAATAARYAEVYRSAAAGRVR